jgi:hypothetical protein
MRGLGQGNRRFRVVGDGAFRPGRRVVGLPMGVDRRVRGARARARVRSR